ncbi:MAG TPA: response regulator, partial [Candidatus Hydrogenedentes bacterium]|nr:response regulator [Candidatus Hydrogenedentota bacterium]
MAGETLLIVDDEAGVRELLEIVLSSEDYRLLFADNPDDAIQKIQSEAPNLVLTDLYMQNDRRAGFRVLSWVKEHCPWVPVIMITAHGTVETAIEAMREGAVDFILKPFPSNDEVRIRLRRALKELSLNREVAALRWALRQRSTQDEMVGSSPKF